MTLQDRAEKILMDSEVIDIKVAVRKSGTSLTKEDV